MAETKIFDEWPEEYDRWFETPIGSLVKKYESRLILDMLEPQNGERILDVGCGTGVFTKDTLSAGARVVGLELSFPMLSRAGEKLKTNPFLMVQGDMRRLPFSDGSFDKAVSVTAIEFIRDAREAIRGLFRITKPGGCIVVATLNRLSPWAARRKASAQKGHSIFKHACFRSPSEMADLTSVKGLAKTAIHFQKDDPPEQAVLMEKYGRDKQLNTGAFLVVRWIKPHEKSGLGQKEKE